MTAVWTFLLSLSVCLYLSVYTGLFRLDHSGWRHWPRERRRRHGRWQTQKPWVLQHVCVFLRERQRALTDYAYVLYVWFIICCVVVLAVSTFCILGTVGIFVFICKDILCLLHKNVVRINVHVGGCAYFRVISSVWSTSSEMTAISFTRWWLRVSEWMTELLTE